MRHGSSGVLSAAAMWVWNLMASTPTSAARSTKEWARPRLPSWPWATSAITAQRSGGTASGSTRRIVPASGPGAGPRRRHLVGHDAAHMADDDLTIRPSVPGDLDQVLAVAARSLGWAADERDRAFFRWKHEENPVGSSPGWVAVDDG